MKLGRGRSVERSLRSELLFHIAFLAAAALFLALWTARLLEFFPLSAPHSTALLVALVVLDVLVFVLLGNYLIQRLLLRPLNEIVEASYAIAAGDTERRAPPGPTSEMNRLAEAVNDLTTQLLRNQQRLAENVQSLHETNRLLQDTQEELVQAEKLASLGRLAAGVAHEIGNPLGALMGYATILRRREMGGELVEGVEREALRIDAIVRDLLDYSRPGTGPREKISINASIRRVLDLLRQQGLLDTLDLKIELAPEEPVIIGVPHRVDQLFVNLFSNAEQAMEGVGRLVVVTTCEKFQPERPVPRRRGDDPPGVDYSHLRRPRHGSVRDSRRLTEGREIVRIVVADTGPGIPQDAVQAVFDPFFTTKEPGKGTGLGLAVVAGTVAELGGRIEVSSAEGAGATFTISLPTAEES